MSALSPILPKDRAASSPARVLSPRYSLDSQASLRLDSQAAHRSKRGFPRSESYVNLRYHLQTLSTCFSLCLCRLRNHRGDLLRQAQAGNALASYHAAPEVLAEV